MLVAGSGFERMGMNDGDSVDYMGMGKERNAAYVPDKEQRQ